MVVVAMIVMLVMLVMPVVLVVPAVGEGRNGKSKARGDEDQFLQHCSLRSNDVVAI
jgi:hypothetical protein